MNIEAWQAQQRAQKEDERKRKLEAEQQLRDYRGTVTEEDTKLTALKDEERKKKQEAAEMLRGYQGTLSEDEIKLAASREEERKKRQAEQQELYSNLAPKETGEDITFAGSVSTMTGVFDAETKKENNENTSAPQEQVPTSISASAKFQFGLIAIGNDSLLQGYIAAVDKIVTDTIGEEMKESHQFKQPFVDVILTDDNYNSPEGRTDVTRRLVTLAVPFVAPNQATANGLRNTIIDAVRKEIERGTFKRLD